MMPPIYDFEAQMTMTAVNSRVHNFSAGPSALPLPVLERMQQELVCLPGAGASVLEISHRGAACDRIFDEAEADLRALLKAGPEYKILFLQGGASQQFAMVPMNLGAGGGYLVTGSWGDKARKEAQTLGAAKELWSGKEGGYRSVPGDVDAAGCAYLHYTSNETIQGVQFQRRPKTEVPLVCDMSSDFLSRPIDAAAYGLIYAGAQKNLGPAGLTVVVVREDLLARAPATLPTIFKYATHVEGGSRYNTPPVFAVYAAGLVCKWLKDAYGDLAGVAAANAEKAALLYDVIDGSEGFYVPHAERDCRSPMNVTWTLKDAALEKDFLLGAQARRLSGLKGHRSVGGMRASLYNAVPKESAAALAAYMREFAAKRG